MTPSEFFEEDEPVEEVVAAFDWSMTSGMSVTVTVDPKGVVTGRSTKRGTSVCPRCGSGTPDCSMTGYTHSGTCATYTYTEDVCATCAMQMGESG